MASRKKQLDCEVYSSRFRRPATRRASVFLLYAGLELISGQRPLVARSAYLAYMPANQPPTFKGVSNDRYSRLRCADH